MTDIRVDDFDNLVARYALRIRRDVRDGGEVGYAHAFVEALTDCEARHSNTRRLQQVRAVNVAAEQVRAERRRFSPTAAATATVAVNPQVSPDSDSAVSVPAAGRAGVPQ